MHNVLREEIKRYFVLWYLPITFDLVCALISRETQR